MHYITCLDGITEFSKATEILESKGLRIKEYGNKMPELFIVKYDKTTCDMSDPDVMKCRGLVLSKQDIRIVCPAPPKSVSENDFLKNFNTTPNDFIIQDFIDGTMVNVFNFNGETFISTRSCLNAKCRWFSNCRN